MDERPDLTKIATNIEFTDGVWKSKSTAIVSYPQEGNDWCCEIEDNSFWFRHRNNCILAAVGNYQPEGMVFDVGAGNGFVALALQSSGYQVACVEPGPEGVRNACDRKLKNIICATIEDAGFKPNSMPAIALFDVIEHIRDDEAFLRLIHQLIQREGRLYLTAPAYRWLWSIEDDFAGHFNRYTINSLRKKLALCRFKVEYATYFFTALPIPIFLFRTAPSKLGFRRSISFDKETQEHELPSHAVGKIIRRIFDWEIGRIEKGRSMAFGASCLVVAKAV